MSRKRVTRDDIPVSFRLPVEIQQKLLAKATEQDLNFSQLVRRALRREVREAGILIKEGK